MNIGSMIRGKMQRKREENTKYRSIYNTEMAKQRELLAKERAQAKGEGMRERAREVAREGRIKPFLKTVGAQLKEHKKQVEKKSKVKAKGIYRRPGESSSGPQFGLSNSNAFDITVNKDKKGGGPKFGL